uniref:Uncharacterized protein n=1 Tax=Timema douglasi TaxID=61478 RepID=A0A7R8ZD88_TIMDO|nr:unnamed protein product [Timema douglasi]
MARQVHSPVSVKTNDMTVGVCPPGHHTTHPKPSYTAQRGAFNPSTLDTSLPFSGLSKKATTNHSKKTTDDTDMTYSLTEASNMEADTNGQGTFTMADKLGRKRKFKPRKHTQTKKTSLTVTNQFEALENADNQHLDNQAQHTTNDQTQSATTATKTRYPPIVTLGTQNYNRVTNIAKDKPVKVVIKGLPPNMATEDIRQELKGLGVQEISKGIRQ